MAGAVCRTWSRSAHSRRCSATWRRSRPRGGCCCRSARPSLTACARRAPRPAHWAWAAGAAPAEVILDFDATPITAHSDKEGAAGHYKGGFGFNPLLVSCGREVLAAVLRPGNAGANNADDHLEVFELALEQLPPAALEGPILARSDSAGASHALADACRETGVRFSFGYAIDARVRSAILALPEAAWCPAINGDGQPREGAWVAEMTGHVSLQAWPEGARLIVRREPAPRRPALVHR